MHPSPPLRRTRRDHVAVGQDEAPRLVHHKPRGVAAARGLRVERPRLGDLQAQRQADQRAGIKLPHSCPPAATLVRRQPDPTLSTTTAGTTESSVFFQASLTTCGIGRGSDAGPKHQRRTSEWRRRRRRAVARRRLPPHAAGALGTLPEWLCMHPGSRLGAYSSIELHTL